MFDAPSMTIAEAMLTSRSSPLRVGASVPARSAAAVPASRRAISQAGGLPRDHRPRLERGLAEQFLTLPAEGRSS